MLKLGAGPGALDLTKVRRSYKLILPPRKDKNINVNKNLYIMSG
jgi:hypothetical protein